MDCPFNISVTSVLLFPFELISVKSHLYFIICSLREETREEPGKRCLMSWIYSEIYHDGTNFPSMTNINIRFVVVVEPCVNHPVAELGS